MILCCLVRLSWLYSVCLVFLLKQKSLDYDLDGCQYITLIAIIFQNSFRYSGETELNRSLSQVSH
jgi:hypothetical protein